MTKQSGMVVVIRDLPEIPGWQGLSRKKQDALVEHKTHIEQHRQLQMLGEFGELMELYQVQQLLEGEDMKLRDYIRHIYPERHMRTIDRKREVFAALVATIPAPVLKRLSAIGTDALSRFDRIANAALGDIKNAVKELPALSASTGDAEKYLQQLDTKLLEHRQARRNGKDIHKDDHESAMMAANALINYIRGCGLKTSAEKRQWLRRVVGWTMEAHAVTGTVSTERVPHPEGVNPKLGRPFKNPPKEAA